MVPAQLLLWHSPGMVATGMRHRAQPMGRGAGTGQALRGVRWAWSSDGDNKTGLRLHPQRDALPSEGTTLRLGWMSLGKPRAPTVSVVYGKKIDSSPRWVSHILPGLGRLSSVMSRAEPSSVELSGAEWSWGFGGGSPALPSISEAPAAHHCLWAAQLPSLPGVQTVFPAPSQLHAARL